MSRSEYAPTAPFWADPKKSRRRRSWSAISSEVSVCRPDWKRLRITACSTFAPLSPARRLPPRHAPTSNSGRRAGPPCGASMRPEDHRVRRRRTRPVQFRLGLADVVVAADAPQDPPAGYAAFLHHFAQAGLLRRFPVLDASGGHLGPPLLPPPLVRARPGPSKRSVS